jgi:hypothetical protein
MEAAKVLVIYWHQKGMISPELIRSCRYAWATGSRPIQLSRIGSESSSEVMRSFEAHQAAAEYLMIALTL